MSTLDFFVRHFLFVINLEMYTWIVYSGHFSAQIGRDCRVRSRLSKLSKLKTESTSWPTRQSFDLQVKSAEFALKHGCSVVICNGYKYNTIRNIMEGKNVGTMFTPAETEGTTVEILAQNARCVCVCVCNHTTVTFIHKAFQTRHAFKKNNWEFWLENGNSALKV